MFFKWIKQHLRIKKFLGNSENAVKTQIWCAVSTYVLIAIVKKELQLNASLYTLLQILSVSVFEKTEALQALQVDSNPIDNADNRPSDLLLNVLINPSAQLLELILFESLLAMGDLREHMNSH